MALSWTLRWGMRIHWKQKYYLPCSALDKPQRDYSWLKDHDLLLFNSIYSAMVDSDWTYGNFGTCNILRLLVPGIHDFSGIFTVLWWKAKVSNSASCLSFVFWKERNTLSQLPSNGCKSIQIRKILYLNSTWKTSPVHSGLLHLEFLQTPEDVEMMTSMINPEQALPYVKVVGLFESFQ